MTRAGRRTGSLLAGLLLLVVDLFLFFGFEAFSPDEDPAAGTSSHHILPSPSPITSDLCPPLLPDPCCAFPASFSPAHSTQLSSRWQRCNRGGMWLHVQPVGGLLAARPAFYRHDGHARWRNMPTCSWGNLLTPTSPSPRPSSLAVRCLPLNETYRHSQYALVLHHRHRVPSGVLHASRPHAGTAC